jgi:hypothetical protein
MSKDFGNIVEELAKSGSELGIQVEHKEIFYHAE